VALLCWGLGLQQPTKTENGTHDLL
jgi:hypothetical protein